MPGPLIGSIPATMGSVSPQSVGGLFIPKAALVLHLVTTSTNPAGSGGSWLIYYQLLDFVYPATGYRGGDLITIFPGANWGFGTVGDIPLSDGAAFIDFHVSFSGASPAGNNITLSVYYGDSAYPSAGEAAILAAVKRTYSNS